MAQPPTVLVDAYNLALGKGTGIATYTRTLVQALQAMPVGVDLLYGLKMHRRASGVDRAVSFFDDKSWDTPRASRRVRRALNAVGAVAFGARAERIERDVVVDASAVSERFPPGAGLLNAHDLYETAAALFALTGRFVEVGVTGRQSLAHWTAPLPVQAVGMRNIYTIHDLVPLVLPYTTLHDKGRFTRLVKAIATKADHIVTVSEASRADIIRLLGVPEDKVTNTYQSVDVTDQPREADEVATAFLQARFGLAAGRYFLFLGAIEPKKNVRRLIEAYIAADVSLPLVIVGQRAWKADEELAPLLMGESEPRAVYELGRGKRIHLVGHAPRAQMITLLRHARAMTFPSLYEGFGLPIVEAMALGVPVMTSNRSATAEVSGGATLLVEPNDPRDLVGGLETLARDDTLVARLASEGRTRAAAFSPEAYRARLTALYARLGLRVPEQPSAG